METEPQISFHGFDASPSLKALIERRIERLERYHPHIIGVRIAVEVPHRRHRTGNVWHVKVNVSVPGKDVAIQREAEVGRRHEVPEAAIRDAFDSARRRLQEHARRMKSEVKVHDPQPAATVDALAGDHGFLTTSDGRSIYFHENSLIGARFAQLTRGSHVTFVEEDVLEGPQASTVKLLASPDGNRARLAAGRRGTSRRARRAG